MTIADNLLSIANTKDAIKTSITNKGVDLTSVPFTDYSVAIDSIATGDVIPDWVRPSDWLPMPNILPTEQKFVALFAVFDHEANDVAFTFGGAYTVDWGDGVIENYSSNSKASHLYNYANISNTTLSTRGYKQVIITVTPQAGQNLISVNTIQAHPLTNKSSFPFLEIKASIPQSTSFAFSGGAVVNSFLESIDILSIGNITSFSFNNLQALQHISYFNTSGVTSLQSCFYNCFMLKKIPDFNFSSVTNVLSAFYNCRSLTAITNIFGVLSGSTSTMFNGCGNLREIPPLNTSNVTNMSSMFKGCYSLTNIPLMDCSKVTDITSMFSDCTRLKSIPSFNFSSVTTNAWYVNGLFESCVSLTKVGSLQFPKLTSIGPMFKDCNSLQEIGDIDFSAVTDTNLSYLFATPSLAKCGISGLKQTFSMANCSLSANELNRIFTNLPVVTGKTITVTGNYGAATCDTTIATAKGWIVSK